MTPYKNFSRNAVWSRRLRRGSLYVAVAGMLAGSAGCGSGDNGSDWEKVEVTEPTKGVVTTLEETEPGKFDIVEETVIDSKDSSRVVIRRLDGSEETLTLAQARGLVQPADTVQNNAQHHHRTGHYGLGPVLWWGTMGYLMGRNMGMPVSPGIYRSGATPAFQELRRTAVTRQEMRPVKGRSGFFKNWGRSGRG